MLPHCLPFGKWDTSNIVVCESNRANKKKQFDRKNDFRVCRRADSFRKNQISVSCRAKKKTTCFQVSHMQKQFVINIFYLFYNHCYILLQYIDSYWWKGWNYLASKMNNRLSSLWIWQTNKVLIQVSKNLRLLNLIKKREWRSINQLHRY